MFIECEFPRKLALLGVGGPGYSTNINSAFSGYERRTENWQQARAAYNVSFESKPVAEWESFEGMFHAARGQANGFRLFDPGDYSGVGQYIGTGDGVQYRFQLQKTYFFPISNYGVVRPVQKPITSKICDYQGALLPDTVEVYLDGQIQRHLPGYDFFQDYYMDSNTGVITFTQWGTGEPLPPAPGVIITADYQYHIPVRFNMDALQKQFITPANGSLLVTVGGIQLVELLIKTETLA